METKCDRPARFFLFKLAMSVFTQRRRELKNLVEIGLNFIYTQYRSLPTATVIPVIIARREVLRHDYYRRSFSGMFLHLRGGFHVDCEWAGIKV